MKSEYYSNYLNSISKGLKSSIFRVNSEKVRASVFLDKVNMTFFNIKKDNNKIFFLGNGASSAFANHMSLDFSKNGKINSRSLSDSALLTALSNDFSYEDAMVEFLKIEGLNNNDLVITISSSGNSSNIVNVLNYCNSNNVKTLSLSGLKEDNKSIILSYFSIYVPMKTYGMVECIHQVFLHLILDNFMNIKEWERDDFQNMNSKNYNL